LAAVPVGADVFHVLAEYEVTRGDVVDDGVTGDVIKGILASHPERFPTDHYGQLQLPVVHLAVGRQNERYVVADDARGQTDEEVGLTVHGPIVHQLGRELASFFDCAIAVLRHSGGDQFDHVLTVVRTRLQHLTRLDRRGEDNLVQRTPGTNGAFGERAEAIPV